MNIADSIIERLKGVELTPEDANRIMANVHARIRYQKGTTNFCEHCGPVVIAFEKDGTSWCRHCLESMDD